MLSTILKLAVVGGIAFVHAETSGGDSVVFTVTKDNFDEFVKDNELALVKFYAPWCGHCKRMAPEYEEAAKVLKDKVVLADVDATVETDIAQQFGIQGYPTLKLLRKGKWEDYNGGRTKDQIIQWIETMTGDAFEVKESFTEAEAAIADSSVGIIVQATKDSEFYKTIDEVANANRLLGKWVVVEGKDESITVVRKEDSETIKNTEAKSADDIVSFLTGEKTPYIGPINGDTFPDYAETGLDFIWYAADEATYKAEKSKLIPIGKALKGQVNLVWLNIEEFQQHAENMLNVTEFPALVYTAEAGRYIYEGTERSVESVSKFFEDAKAGKIERSLKSEDVPETNDEPVKVVVGKNFEESVFHKDKDVLLEVYAPWCGHCKKLEPDYTSFATSHADNEHLVVAKLDGTANEIPVADFQFRGFPTIFFVKAGETKPMMYNGERTADGLAKFYDENASFKKADEKEEL